MSKSPRGAIEWRIESMPVAYKDATAEMERLAAAIRSGEEGERVWLLEHPSLYTAGTSAQPEELLAPHRFPVFKTGRGGKYTYHGPGQRVAYAMLDLTKRRRDVRRYVHDLEAWLILALAELGVVGERRSGRVGIWVDRGRHGGPSGQEDKIAAIGVRIRHWVSYHGIAINVHPDLSHFAGIIACGIAEHGITSFADLGLAVTMDQVDLALRAAFEEVFERQTATTFSF